MNKKLLAGFSMLVTVGAFWACGDGSINKMDVSDELMATQYNSDNPEKAEQLKKQALEDCEKDPVCKATYADYLANPDAPPPTSSEGSTTNPTSSNSAGTPTSSAGKLVIGGNSSASQTGTSSAGDVGTSSASVAVPGEPTCEPTPKSISVGGTATWTFSPNTTDMTATMAYMEAEFTWTLGSETDGGKGVMSTKAVAYNTAGPQTATVSVKNGLDTKTYTCSALQVNSEKPTCTCTAAGGDLQKGSTATWTAVCDNSNVKYIWNGTAGEKNTFETAYTAADVGNKLTPPTLGVEMVDGSKFDGADGFTCDEVKVTDGPEYVLTVTGDQLNASVELKEEGCITVSGEWTNSYDLPTAKVLCEVQGQGVSLSISYNGSDSTWTGDYGVNNVGVTLGPVAVGPLSWENICVSFKGGSVAKCNLAR